MSCTESSPDRFTWTPPPWEPPLAGTELEHLLGCLDRLRATFFWKVSGLDHAGIQVRIGTSSLSLASLVAHVSAVEDDTTTTRLAGASIGEPGQSIWDGGAGHRWPQPARARGRRRGTHPQPEATAPRPGRGVRARHRTRRPAS
ncbi:MAG: DinB family protein [Nocardioides sp.]|nr:DinB family protein [Nocardioides sp.]